METLMEIEAAIVRLPAADRRQLLRDLPALCPDAEPLEGWDALLQSEVPRPALSALVDHLDAAYPAHRENFLSLNEASLSRTP